ncbi:MAG: alkane 1-monooxygenase [Litoreibacter sp.]|uniref:alkane 1-monooxygenase n=1 Tax=Litoreibacter sp. TaxID=1969459 RepID=UPI0032998A7F
MTTLPSDDVSKFSAAVPFWLSLVMIPLTLVGASQGGWWLALLPLYGWGMFTVLDAITGLNLDNADLETTEDDLFWYRAITIAWFPLQFLLIFGMIAYATRAPHLSGGEQIALFFGIGVVSGTIGINYSHELMHQKNRLERWLGDLLLASVLYSHFRSEHLLTHHRYVATPKDPVTARYNEGFHRYFPRVLRESVLSAWGAEKAMLERKNLPASDTSNPFYRYVALQAAMLLLAFMIGGWAGLGLFVLQAYIAIWQLELVNYIEHYGLTRKHLGEGKYEHVQPRHSWNAAHRASNWLLINLQRHSDHHYKPDRRFPLLQNHTAEDAPQLPYGYPVMTMAAMVPPVYRRIMNPKVRKWRAMYYPEITDWAPYKTATNPVPR